MNSRRNNFAIAGALIVVAVVLFLILKPDSSDKSQKVTNSATAGVTGSTGATDSTQPKKAKPKPPPVPTVIVKNGTPVDGVLGIEVNKGDQITFKVISDVDEEIHVHGYDISKDVTAGGSVTLSFKADITGIFEAELENSGVEIARLQINP